MAQGNTPHKRNWLDEALRIRAGDQNIKPKREHILALGEALSKLEGQLTKIQPLMKTLRAELEKKKILGVINGTK